MLWELKHALKCAHTFLEKKEILKGASWNKQKSLLKYCSSKIKNTKIYKNLIIKILHNNSIYFTNSLMSAKLLDFYLEKHLTQLKPMSDDTCLVSSVFCQIEDQMASAVY